MSKHFSAFFCFGLLFSFFLFFSFEENNIYYFTEKQDNNMKGYKWVFSLITPAFQFINLLQYFILLSLKRDNKSVTSFTKLIISLDAHILSLKKLVSNCESFWM